MDNIGEPQQEVFTITSQELAAKTQGKREIFMFLCIDVRAYLPDATLISIYFMKDLISGLRKFVKQEDVKHLYVPFYDNITV